MIDRLEVDARKGGVWVPQTVKTRRSGKYMHEVTLAEPVSAVKMRLRFPGVANRANTLEIYEIELPRLPVGNAPPEGAPSDVLKDEGMSLVWDGSDCPNADTWSSEAWYSGDVAEPCANGGFTVKKRGTRYLRVNPEDEWLVVDVAAFHIKKPTGYRAWWLSIETIGALVRTATEPQKGIYTFRLPRREKAAMLPLRIDPYGLTMDVNSIKVGKRPANRVDVASSTADVVAPGSELSVRVHLAKACEDVAAEFLFTPDSGSGAMTPFPVNGKSALELRRLDDEGYEWGADVKVSTCGKARQWTVLLKVTPLGDKTSRSIFGGVREAFSSEAE